MLIPNQWYEFVPPDGDPLQPIVALGLQEYSPDQVRKVDVWKLQVPASYAALFGDHVEFETFAAMCAALARHFCNGDAKAAQERLVSKKVGI